MQRKYVPSNWTLIECPEVDATIYTYQILGCPYAVAYSGDRKKSDFNFKYASFERREEHIHEYIENLKKNKSEGK